jgi:pimeloyl-ACP methyl ester carboxylesterase
VTPTPFTPHIDDAVIADLKRRLGDVRWAPDYGNDDWSYGVKTSYMQELAEYWRTQFDWPAQEAKIAAFDHFKVDLDGVPIHFIHERGKGPKPIPLILSHGWPWTFWDLKDLIRPLTDPAAFGGDPADAFDVVVPSLPGFAFSSPLTKTGVNFWRTAELWVELMTKVLGYERFAAQGGDWGGHICGHLGHKHPDKVIGIHLTTALNIANFSHERNWDIRGADLLPSDSRARAAALARQRKFASHIAVHVLDPQTLAIMAHASPVALCAWMLERRRAWSDCGGDVEARFSKDDLLTHMTLFWATETFGSSVRFYAETARDRWIPTHQRWPVVGVPTGLSIFVPDSGHGPTEAQKDYYNLVYAKEHLTGGHFAAAEEPARVVEDIRATFRGLR